MADIDLATMRQAQQRIAPYIHQTPIATSSLLDQSCNCQIYFKCENQQKVGAFKIRGAVNAVFSLSVSEADRGVATHSSGNHGAALARAAQMRGIRSFVVMPDNAPTVKKEAVAGYGANIRFCEPTLPARESTLQRLIEETGANIIHPYDDVRIINGQGTTALEMCEQVSGLNILLAPVGGGGLLAGVAVAMKALSPRTLVMGAEPEQADDAYRSFRTGVRVTDHRPNTVADGLLTTLGTLNFAIIRRSVDDILTVPESKIVEAMKLIWTRLKQVVEPSAAVPLAAVLTHGHLFTDKKVGLILSGGNVDLDNLPW
ncbi:MAG: pyridoxal-phosphate dependent enzyme [Pseudomonadales bacterium]|jgi:threonine dehydratase|nr:pyridoxal-phosphate dependent enzyme [Pseudomonadales bacterium]MDP7360827.1 pyridoxal-phosphate dependent enzyme [Pseudomonadales bacterium]MDP7594293.1 pyridoxal-phosphate dependent enzyme [Pseudomonadales bacterium]HJN51992.1 pyridoxal-phosphate dependent enzyme [Pseudomonadales bacterium]